MTWDYESRERDARNYEEAALLLRENMGISIDPGFPKDRKWVDVESRLAEILSDAFDGESVDSELREWAEDVVLLAVEHLLTKDDP